MRDLAARAQEGIITCPLSRSLPRSEAELSLSLPYPSPRGSGRVSPVISYLPGCGRTHGNSAYLCPRQGQQLPSLVGGLGHSVPGVLNSGLCPGAPP